MTKKSEMTQAISSTSTGRTKCDTEQESNDQDSDKFLFGGGIAVVLEAAARINHWKKTIFSTNRCK